MMPDDIKRKFVNSWRIGLKIKIIIKITLQYDH